MPQLEVSVSISAERFLEYYRGSAKAVMAKATDGRTVKFPANLLQPFLDRSGVHGRFRIEFDARGRCQKIERVN